MRMPPSLRLIHDCRHILALVAVRGAHYSGTDGPAVALAVQVIQDHMLRPRQR